jgi:hypothetical protein
LQVGVGRVDKIACLSSCRHQFSWCHLPATLECFDGVLPQVFLFDSKSRYDGRTGAPTGVVAGAFAAGADDTKTGAATVASAGAELLPAGWLAAAAMRAASSLESRFFFIQGPLL